MYIPCETCFSRYKREYSKECDTFCDYARAIKENKEYQKSEVLNRQIKNMDDLIKKLECGVTALNRIGADAFNKRGEQNED